MLPLAEIFDDRTADLGHGVKIVQDLDLSTWDHGREPPQSIEFV
jgi:hypothetical protein